LKYLSLFSGIGAFEKALQRLEIPYDLVGYSEIDRFASKAYSILHHVPESMNLGDITKINEKELPDDIDLITYGFPCQDISVAGHQQGLFNDDGTQTRSGLFFDALRVITHTQPKIAIAENVKNLTSDRFKEQFKIVLDSLEDAGYVNHWTVLDAKDFGVPQSRNRVFIVSIRKDIDTGIFEFPEPIELGKKVKDILEEQKVDEKYYVKQDIAERLIPQLKDKDIANAIRRGGKGH
jgi:DNA (cytosine-5)-methyltransferase 1